ncbi:MAG: hypothetical protein LBR56_06130, partial [Sporomusaceae bacterium]|jgi:hypothetical protein|nr:hypothetical protein [Sporomusaceae bacterium]
VVDKNGKTSYWAVGEGSGENGSDNGDKLPLSLQKKFAEFRLKFVQQVKEEIAEKKKKEEEARIKEREEALASFKPKKQFAVSEIREKLADGFGLKGTLSSAGFTPNGGVDFKA